MAILFPQLISTPAAVNATPDQEQEQQLGTEESGFADSLLGLQAAEKPTTTKESEEANAEAFALLSDLLAPNFGQDAAMPMVAENGAMQAFSALEKAVPQIPVRTLDIGKTPALPLLNLTEGMGTEDPFRSLQTRSNGTTSGAEAREMLSLLGQPVEDLQPNQLKKLVDSVWGDVSEVKVEDAPTATHADSTQHVLMKHMALKNGDATTPTHLQAASSAVAEDKAVEVPTFQTNQSDRKVLTGKSAEPHSDFAAVDGSQLSETNNAEAETQIGKADKTGLQSSAPKLMPQVMPKLETLIQQGGGKLTMELDPPELGRLTIELTTRGKHVELAIRSDNEGTRAALEGGMADLQQALQSQDLQLTRAEVHSTRESSFASMNFGQGTSQQEQSSSQEGRQSYFGREEKTWSRNLQSEAPIARNRNAGRLDVRV